MIELSDEDRAFRDELRAFIEANRDALDDEHAWHERLVAGDWAVPGWPEKWGGRDATLAQEVVYNEEMAAVDAPIPRNSIALFNIGPMLLLFGTDEQKERWLPPMVRAEEIWCQGFSEPAAGSDLAALETRAEDRGDHWSVTGQKVWTTFGHEADLCLALVRTDPMTAPGADHAGTPKHRGLSALVVDMHDPGVDVRPLREITGDDGFNEIFFEDVRVDKDRVVGEVNGGWKVAMSTLLFERLGTMKLGIQLRQRLDQLVALARDLGRDGDALVRQRLAELAVQVDLMQLLTEQALDAMRRGEDPGVSLPLGKLQWSELMQELAELALDLQGPAAQLYRDPRAVDGDWQYHTVYSRMTTIGAGTTQVQKNIIATRILGLPRDAGAEPSPGKLADRPVSDERAGLRDTVRRFLADRCPTSWVRDLLDDPRGTTDAVWKEMASLGLTGILVPEEHGGLGLGYTEMGIVLEELGRAVHPGPYASSALGATTAVLGIATGDERADLLPGLASGETVATLALLEPDAGWDWRRVGTVAVGEDASWRLDGAKRFVPDGVAADLLLVTARTDAGEVGLFAVQTDSTGVDVEPLQTVDATKKQAEVVLRGAPARRLGSSDVTAGLATVVDRIVAGLTAEAVGAAHRGLELANDYAKVREQFDRPIGSFQAIQHLLADMLRRVELARAGAAAALAAADGDDPAEAHRLSVMAKAYASDALYRVTADAIQVHGGIGFTWEHDAHLYYKRAMALQHAFGGSAEFRDVYAGLLLDGEGGGA